jgi:hypothetical protein
MRAGVLTRSSIALDGDIAERRAAEGQTPVRRAMLAPSNPPAGATRARRRPVELFQHWGRRVPSSAQQVPVVGRARSSNRDAILRAARAPRCLLANQDDKESVRRTRAPAVGPPGLSRRSARLGSPSRAPRAAAASARSPGRQHRRSLRVQANAGPRRPGARGAARAPRPRRARTQARARRARMAARGRTMPRPQR